MMPGGETGMDAVEIDRVLVPLDASEEALDAIEYGIGIAERYEADVHALYVLDETIARGLETGDLDEATIAAETEKFMDSVEAAAANHDVVLSHSTAFGFLTSELSRHPGSVILDAAEEVGADFLVVPRQPVSGDPAEVLGKAAEYVLMYASQPVLSV
jgi:nucleotide-binding universal stress UspA family protein